jgi:ABC-type lipoprotein release transport system permease subunit
VQVAHRNIWRNKNRTLLLGGAFVVVALVTTLLFGYTQGITQQMRQKVIDVLIGDAVICSRNSETNALGYEKISDFDARESLKRLPILPGIEFRWQYRNVVLVYSKGKQRDGLLAGLEVKDCLKFKIISGQPLGDDEAAGNEILISGQMADDFNIGIGDDVAVEAITSQGMRNFDYFRVRGIFQVPGTPEIMVAHILVSRLDSVQRLVDVGEERVTEILAVGKERSQAGNLTGKLRQYLDSKHYRVIDQAAYGSMVFGILQAFVVMFLIISVISVLISAVFLFDSMLAAMEERKREYGIMLCQGLSRGQIGSILFSEFAWFSVYFLLPAIVLGFLIVQMFGIVGIPAPASIQAFLGGIEKLYPSLSLASALLIWLGMTGLIQALNAYFIMRISRINPIEVFRGV